jgi:putative membrane protein
MRARLLEGLVLAVGCCVLLATHADGRQEKTKAVSDKDFINEAATGGMTEVKLGQLAADQGNSDDVRKFGKRMVDDHSAANKDLVALLSKKGMTAPKEMTKKQQELFDHLSKLRGPEFDKAYIKHMIEDHKEDVGLFEGMSKSGSDPDLKAFASKSLPTIKEHLKLAEQIQGKLGK